MSKIKINDIEMYYEIHGKGEPLVFISGFSADHVMWSNIIDKFKDHFTVMTFDNRGAGQTDVPKGRYSIDQLAQDVVDLCEKLKIKKAHFVGNSMGGFILQTLAWKHPALVQSAVITNSALTMETTFIFQMQAQLELLKANAPLHAIATAGCAWAFSYSFLSQPGMLDKIIQLRMSNPFPFTIPGFEGQLAALLKFDSRNWAHQITVPTFVMGGDQDLVFRESSIRALADKIPNAQYFCFKDCGHVPSMEYPDLFVEKVMGFFNFNRRG